MQLTNDGFDTIVRRLQGYKKKNLLVLDNLQNAEDFEKVKPLNVNFDILITTRAKLNSDNIINLETLNDEDAKELFLGIYNTDENIDDVLKYLDNHPLFIKLMAYSLKEEYIELEELKDDIKKRNISKIDSENDKTFKEHLQNTFNKQFTSEARDELKELLKVLALFPAIEIDFEILKKILDDKKLKAKLQKLVSRGWLTKKENSYKLHQIIKTFMLEEYFVEYEEVTYILDNIGDYIDPTDLVLIASQLSEYIPIIDSLLSLFEDKEDEHIAKILDSNTFLYYSLGEYKNSLEMQEKSFEIRKKLYGDESELTALNYSLLGVLYKEQGKYEKEELLYAKALNIYEKVLGEEHPHTANSYNNLAVLYFNTNRFEEAYSYMKKAVEIRSKVLPQNHPDLQGSKKDLETITNKLEGTS